MIVKIWPSPPVPWVFLDSRLHAFQSNHFSDSHASNQMTQLRQSKQQQESKSISRLSNSTSESLTSVTHTSGPPPEYHPLFHKQASKQLLPSLQPLLPSSNPLPPIASPPQALPFPPPPSLPPALIEFFAPSSASSCRLANSTAFLFAFFSILLSAISC